MFDKPTEFFRVPILYYATTHSMLLHFLYLISLPIFPAKSHKIIFSPWYHPVPGGLIFLIAAGSIGHARLER